MRKSAILIASAILIGLGSHAQADIIDHTGRDPEGDLSARVVAGYQQCLSNALHHPVQGQTVKACQDLYGELGMTEYAMKFYECRAHGRSVEICNKEVPGDENGHD